MSENCSVPADEEPLVPTDDPVSTSRLTVSDLKALRRSWSAGQVAGRPDLESLVAYCAGAPLGDSEKIRAQLTEDLGLIDLALRVDDALATVRGISWRALQELARSKPKETDDLMPGVANAWLRLLRSRTAIGSRESGTALADFVHNWLRFLAAPGFATARGEGQEEEAGGQRPSGNLGRDVEYRIESARIDEHGNLVVRGTFHSRNNAPEAFEGRDVILSLRTGGALREIARTRIAAGQATWRVELYRREGSDKGAQLRATAFSVGFEMPPSPRAPHTRETILIAPVRQSTSGRITAQIPITIIAEGDGEDLLLTVNPVPHAASQYPKAEMRLDVSVCGGWQQLGQWPLSEHTIRLEHFPGEARASITSLLRAELLLA